MDTPQRKVACSRGAGCLGSDPLVLAPGPAPVYDDADWINAIPVKLPELWQSKERSWFAQAEAQFANQQHQLFIDQVLSRHQGPAGEFHRADFGAPHSAG